MKVLRGLHHPYAMTHPTSGLGLITGTAVTIGNFDGVHRGHQAMLALLRGEAEQRGAPTCVLTFEPHPRDYFAALFGKPELAPARICTLRDKLADLQRAGIDQVVILPFNARIAALSPEDFVEEVLVRGLDASYVLVGDDFRFGAKRAGDYALLDTLGDVRSFDVARMQSYQVRNLRISSSAVRAALAEGRMEDVERLLGHPYHISGHVLHGCKPRRELDFRTLSLRFPHWKPAASGVFVVRVHGLVSEPLPGVANLGVRPSLNPDDVNGGHVLLEIYCLEWPTVLDAEGAYGKTIRVELLHKLHDDLRYDSTDALNRGMHRDCEDARTWFASEATSLHAQTRRQTVRARI